MIKSINSKLRAFSRPNTGPTLGVNSLATRRFGRNRQMQMLSQITSIMGIFNAAATMPQVLTIFSSADASSLSIVSWGYYLAFSIVLFVFGIMNGQKPLILTYGSSSIVYILVVAGIIIHG